MCEMNQNSHISHLRSQLDFRSHSFSLDEVQSEKLIYCERQNKIRTLSDK